MEAGTSYNVLPIQSLHHTAYFPTLTPTHLYPSVYYLAVCSNIFGSGPGSKDSPLPSTLRYGDPLRCGKTFSCTMHPASERQADAEVVNMQSWEDSAFPITPALSQDIPT